MKNCIVIPTYWSTPKVESWKTFDHPTPVDENGTLRRTLENLETMKLDVPVFLFPAPTDQQIENKVCSLARGIKLDLRVFSHEDLDGVRKAMADRGFPDDFAADVHMNSYGAIRNMGLLYAALNGFDNVIQIDDDELIEDPDYMKKAVEFLGRTLDGDAVLGKTGFYRDAGDNVFYDGQATFTFKNWPKDELFNEAVKRDYERKERLAPCIEAHGGNMVINRQMFLKVPYDPYGTRGEDDDYAVNALYRGLKYFSDRELWVRHLPPQRTGSYWTRQRQDIIRFKYLREKALLMGLEPEELGIFLGRFVRDDLEHMAVSSAIDAALRFLDRDRGEFTEFLNNAVVAEEISRNEMKDQASRFLMFCEAWADVMPKVEGLWK